MIRIENEYLKFDVEDIYISKKTGLPKKITGHSFVALIGKDSFKKRGDCVIELLKLLPAEPIDEFYTKRGEIAEFLIKKMYDKKLNTYQTWNPKVINYDNFSEVSKYFGGLVDGLLEGSTIVEIKSKSMDKYDFIKNNAIESEEYQAKLYATLWNLINVKMQYVFFDEECENKIRNNEQIQPADLKNCTRIEKDLIVDNNLIKNYMSLALKYYLSCFKTLSIPLADISPSYVERLKNEKGLVY